MRTTIFFSVALIALALCPALFAICPDAKVISASGLLVAFAFDVLQACKGDK